MIKLDIIFILAFDSKSHEKDEKVTVWRTLLYELNLLWYFLK